MSNFDPTAEYSAIREGYLSAMIPEEYGGSGLNLTASAAILEEIHKNGCNAAACRAQMYTMGTVLRHGSEEQKRKFREARLYQVAPISTNLILCFIAEQVLGLPKSYGDAR